MMNTCYQVIRRNVAAPFKNIMANLEEILAKKPELHQEINALIVNSGVGALAQAGEQASALYSEGAFGMKGLENGKGFEAFDFIKRVDAAIPTAISSVERFLASAN